MQREDEDAFLEHSGHRLRRFASYLLRTTTTRVEVDDIVQTAFAAALAKRLDLTGGDERVRSYLRGAVRNAIRAARRHAGSRLRLEDLPREPVCRDGPPSTEALLREELGSVLGRFRPEQRQLLLLRFLDGCSIEEIAERLKIPVGTVKSRLRAALRRAGEQRAVRDYLLGEHARSGKAQIQ